VAVERDGAYANLTLPALLSRSSLDTRDRALATELAYGSLRWTGSLDRLISLASSRELGDLDLGMLAALRLGSYQLVALRVAPHAAVDQTVELARDLVGEGAAGFANAVMRRIADRVARSRGPAEPGALGELDVAALFGAPPLARDPAAHLAVVEHHPRWIVDAFAEALAADRRSGVRGTGGPWGQVREALAADDKPGATHLVARPGRITLDELTAEATAAGLRVEPGRWSPYAVHVQGDPALVPAIRDGRAAVQDEGSQLVALALAHAPTLGEDRGLTVDLCAGPGGKAGLLAAAGGSARLVALEPRAARARLVATTTRDLPVAVAVADGRTPPVLPGSADRVLVDAPCTGLGALRRRPEARWRRDPDAVAGLVPLQRSLLAAGLRLLRPGGVLLYATCSPHVAETDGVVADVLAGTPDVTPVDVRPLLPAGMPDLGDGPAVRLWPHRHGTDAMYLAALRRAAGS
jgi:16S rRNA (cytosine967-C5)-methyltransferase